MVATQVRSRSGTISKLIEQPGLQMPLGAFFDKWIKTLYGIEKHKCAVQRGIDFRSGYPIHKTWKQTCYFELQQWGITEGTAKGWGADWEIAPEIPRRLAYFMNQILLEDQSEYQEESTRQKAGKYHY